MAISYSSILKKYKEIIVTSQESGRLWGTGEECDWERYTGDFWGTGKGLLFDLGDGYTGVHFINFH